MTSPRTPTANQARALKVVVTIAAGIVALLLLNTMRASSDSASAPISAASVLSLPGSQAQTAAEPPEAAVQPLATTAPLQVPTPTLAPAPSPTPVPTATPLPTATPAPAPSATAVPPTPVAATPVPATPVPASPAPVEAAAPTVEPTLAPEATATPETVSTATAEVVVEPTTAPTTEITVEPTAEPTAQPTAAALQPVAELEAFVLGEVNQIRANAGLGPLTLDATVSALARDWSQQMAAGDFFEHRPANQFDTLLPTGWQRWAENIAAAPDIFWAQSSLETSSGHYANMVGPYNTIGIGVATNGTRIYLTQVFATY